MKKILMVEDIADNAAVVRKIIESQGHEFLWASNAATGLQMALDHLPDLILLDLGLPDVDGQTLSIWMRGEHALRNTPLVVMTAWPEEVARRMVKAYQLDGYVGKPFEIKHFLKVISPFLVD